MTIKMHVFSAKPSVPVFIQILVIKSSTSGSGTRPRLALLQSPSCASIMDYELVINQGVDRIKRHTSSTSAAAWFVVTCASVQALHFFAL